MKYLNKLVLVSILNLVFGIVVGLNGQTGTIFTAGLNRPDKIITAGENSLLVAEAGTRSPNTGRISLVNRGSGFRQTLIGGLPSAVSFLGGPAGDPDGPSGLLLRGRVLYVVIGVGDTIIPGPAPGQERVNPNPPSSPIFDSVLALTLPDDYESFPSEFTLSGGDQATLAGGGPVFLISNSGRMLFVRMVANLPDYRPAPLPFPNENNVKASHLFGIESFESYLFVVDAGLNDLKRIEPRTGEVLVFASFPNRPNPMFPALGGPVLEAVPDNIRRVGDQLLVPLLTGFPFVAGQAEIRSVNLQNGGNAGLISNLTSAIDVLYAEPSIRSVFVRGDNPVNPGGYYTLEYSTRQFPPPPAPGRLRFYSSPSAAPVDLLTNLITPTSMARDNSTRDIFITNIDPGTLTKVSFP